MTDHDRETVPEPVSQVGQVGVTMFHRRPLTSHFSLERLFRDVSAAMPPTVRLRQLVLPYESTGVWNRVRNVAFVRRNRDEVNHVTGDVHLVCLGLPRRRTVLTVHDCVGLLRLSGPRRWVLYVFWYWMPVRWCRTITVVSEQTGRELTAFVPAARSKTVVVHDTVSPEFTPTEKEWPSKPVVLQVGTAPNKNVDRVVDALTGLHVRLRIIGSVSDALRSRLASSGLEWSAAHDLTDAEVVTEYRQADLVTFVSTYEGFGMPILEAQASGRCVITSKTAPMCDVAGPGALLVDPEDVNAIREVVVRLLNDPALRRTSIEAGLLNVRRFQPEEIARQFETIYWALRS